jgi:hypothetical protein
MTNLYYYDKNGQKRGPITSEQLQTLVTNEIVTPATIIVTADGSEAAAESIDGLFSTPPPNDDSIPPVYSGSPTESSAPQGTSATPPTVTNPWAALDQEIQGQQVSQPNPVSSSPPSPILPPTYGTRSSSGRLIVVSEPIVYIPKNLASVWFAFFTIMFDGKPDKSGYFEVDGKPCEFQISSNDNKIVGIEIVRATTTTTVSYFRQPGTANITVTVGNESVVRTIKVVEIPIKGGFTDQFVTNSNFLPSSSQEVIKELGFPDEELNLTIKPFYEITKDHIHYKPEIGKGAIFAKHWRYNKHPGLVISIVGEKVFAISTCTPQMEQLLPALWNKHEMKFMGAGGCAGLILLGVIGLLGSSIGCCCLLVSLLF